VRAALILAAGLLWAPTALAQDAPGIRDMSPSDLYVMLRESEGGIRCYPTGDYGRQLHDEAINARYARIRPWLVAAIGEAEFERLKESLADLNDPGYYFGCPSDEQQSRDDYRENRALQEMERRARIARRTKR